MARASTAGATVRPLPWTVIAAAVCLVVYIVVMLLQPDVARLLGYKIGGGRTRAHMMARVVAALVMTWGLFQAARWAWWAATVFAVLASTTGLLAVVFPGRFGHVHYLVDMITAPVGLAALMMLTVFLLLPQTRAFFLQPPAE